MGFLDFLTSTKRPAAGVPPASPEKVKQALLAVNRPTAPFRVVDGKADGADLVAEWKVVDAQWYGIFEKSGFKGRDDSAKLIAALEGLEMKEGDDFPQGDKVLRKDDHQAFLREFIFDIHEGKHRILDTVAKEKTLAPPACKFA